LFISFHIDNDHPFKHARQTLCTTHRLQVLQNWKRNSGKVEDVPTLEGLDLDTFAGEFSAFYLQHMPAWRLEFGDTIESLSMSVPPGETWPELCKGGRNGLFLLVVMMHWWNLATRLHGGIQRVQYHMA
jgi:hypothetical protein